MFKVTAFENFESYFVTVKMLSDFVAGRKRDVGSTFRKFHFAKGGHGSSPDAS